MIVNFDAFKVLLKHGENSVEAVVNMETDMLMMADVTPAPQWLLDLDGCEYSKGPNAHKGMSLVLWKPGYYFAARHRMSLKAQTEYFEDHVREFFTVERIPGERID